MIESIFFLPPSILGITSPHRYRVDNIYQLGSYTLVEWAYGDLDGEYSTGNSLYHNHNLLVCSGGYLDLGATSNSSEVSSIDETSTAVTLRFNLQIGAYGIPYPIAKQIRDSSNLVPFN